MECQKMNALNNLLNQLLNDDEESTLWGLQHPDFFYENEEALLDVLFSETGKRIQRLDSLCYGKFDMDLVMSKWCGETVEDCENKRKEYIEEIRKTSDTIERLQKAIQYARKINEWEIFYHVMEIAKRRIRPIISIEICRIFFEKNATMEEVLDFMPWLDKTDVYGLSVMLNMPMNLSDTDMELIRKDCMKTGIPEVLKTVFVEPNRQSEQQDNNNEW